ncbi:glycolate oxidase subunit GlcF [Wenxinia saemankumensis]|uniref:Glycolate oxidase iron-sulfur subunit n=1 Tax=Wenxinia saemankumensis TaxID=1447782 RepID=A0A1M6GU95_9RHOB|nr:glycolate oxidase subunit GlcF [Wenxinia saemankumensis]SHJ13479.1 glycolate oxidase iron-sulfur subunit [Wenxinia saemankumensis]
MQTTFTPEQLTDPGIARSNEILRACVHCGFCTATCPTYQVLGDELDSPRGRIYLIKDMLENDRDPDPRTVTHIDRCLSCLACMTTCPSGVHYMHLVDHARAYIEARYTRPWPDRALRWVLAQILPHPGRFRAALMAARLGRPLRGLMPGARLKAMLDMAPRHLPPPSPSDAPQVFPAEGTRRMRVALMTGCAQKALNTDINEATIRLLTRLGAEVVVADGAGCCGALVHHMGKEEAAHRFAARNIRAWMSEKSKAGLDAIVINTSGCGTTVKDYGHMFRTSPLAGEAAAISSLARDVSEVLVDLLHPDHVRTTRPARDGIAGIDAPPAADAPAPGMRVAYHAACSLQHGQRIKAAPKDLLRTAGFEVVEPADPHLCCGSAGTYNLMQPAIAGKLRDRKVRTLEAKAPEVIAAGNIGCMMQIGGGTGIPVVHTVELLDWATGGPRPRALGGDRPGEVPILR